MEPIDYYIRKSARPVAKQLAKEKIMETSERETRDDGYPKQKKQKKEDVIVEDSLHMKSLLHFLTTT